MTRQLHALLAADKTIRNDGNRRFTAAYQRLQSPAAFEGLSRTYAPDRDDAPGLPPEGNPVQAMAEDVTREAAAALTELIDNAAAREATNQNARADIVLPDGTTLASAVPVGTLLFLEKQLVHLSTVFRTIPTQDATERWQWSDEAGCWVAPAKVTLRTQKTPKVVTKADATDKHPAQTEMYWVDEPVGRWSNVRRTGALPGAQVRDMIRRADILLRAVKAARTAANTATVIEQPIGKDLVSYVLAPLDTLH